MVLFSQKRRGEGEEEDCLGEEEKSSSTRLRIFVFVFLCNGRPHTSRSFIRVVLGKEKAWWDEGEDWFSEGNEEGENVLWGDAGVFVDVW